jgi:hypothetical protein
MIKKSLCAIVMALVLLPIAADEKGFKIAEKYYNLKRPDDLSTNVTMVLIDASGSRQVRRLVMKSRDQGGTVSSFYEFLEPADVSGTKFLSTEVKGGETTQRLYLPALKKIRRIASSGKGTKFMGSDLFYYDMENHELADYTYELLKEGVTLKGKPFAGMTFSVIKMIPVDEDCPYGYSLAWVNEEDNFVYQMAPSDRDGKLVKVIMMLETRTIDGIIIPAKTLIINKQEDHKTLLTFDNIILNSGLNDQLFQVQSLK